MTDRAKNLPWLIVLSLGLSVFILVLLTFVYSNVRMAQEILATSGLDETLAKNLDTIEKYLAVSASAVFGWIFMQVFVIVGGFGAAKSDKTIRLDRSIASVGAIFFVLHIVMVIITYTTVQKLSLDCSNNKDLSFICNLVKKTFESVGQKIIRTISRILIGAIILSAVASIPYVFGSLYLFLRRKEEYRAAENILLGLE